MSINTSSRFGKYVFDRESLNLIGVDPASVRCIELRKRTIMSINVVFESDPVNSKLIWCEQYCPDRFFVYQKNYWDYSSTGVKRRHYTDYYLVFRDISDFFLFKLSNNDIGEERVF